MQNHSQYKNIEECEYTGSVKGHVLESGETDKEKEKKMSVTFYKDQHGVYNQKRSRVQYFLEEDNAGEPVYKFCFGD
jgi:hypothetical protein